MKSDMYTEKDLMAKFASADNFVISLRLGDGLDLKDFEEVIDAITSLRSDSLMVSKELALLFVEIPRAINGSLGLYEGSEKQEILAAMSKLYAAIYSSLSTSSR
jgi:hypothetical protein